jgi:hypothetical protein
VDDQADIADDEPLDALDQALAVSKPRRKRGPKSRLEDVVRRQLKAAERLARRQREFIDTNHKDVDFVKAFNDTTKSIANLSETLRRIHESERKAFAGLNEEQLQAVFRGQLSSIAIALTDDEKRMMLEQWFGVEVTDVLMKRWPVTQ